MPWFCRETEEGDGDDLTFKGVIDLVDIPMPEELPGGDGPRVLAEVDAQLAFCIAGRHRRRAHAGGDYPRPWGPACPGPPPQAVTWDEGIFFQRWIKPFRIPVTRLGRHVAAIAFDGMPLGGGELPGAAETVMEAGPVRMVASVAGFGGGTLDCGTISHFIARLGCHLNNTTVDETPGIYLGWWSLE